MPVYPQTVTLRDAKGNIAATRFFVSDTTAALALVDATNITNLITPMSNASLQRAVGAYTTSPTTQTYGASAEYNTAEDKMVLTFVTASGSIHRYMIPAPKSSQFLADQETANSAATELAAFITAVTVNKMCSRDGSLITAYIGGIRRRVKLNRRLNIFTLAPNLSIPAE